MARLARFLEPPRLRTLEADRERRATWLELFLDLVFVAAAAEVALTLGDDPTAAGFARYLALFVPIGWAWAGFTFYATRFDTDDLVYRLLTLLGMVGVAGLASAVPDALHGGQNRFVLAYVFVRVILLIAVVLGTVTVNWTAASIATAFAGFLAAAALWWPYFDFFDASVVNRNVLSGITFVYAHYFVTAGIAALGVGVKLTILSAAPGPRYDGDGWIAAAGVAMCMVGLAVIQLAIPPVLFDADVVLRLAVAAFAALLLGLTDLLSPVVILWLLAGALVAQIVAELGAHERHAAAAPGPL